jgi:hypothetical protein
MKNTNISRIKETSFLLIVILIFTLFLTTNIKAGAPATPVFTVPPADTPDPVTVGNDVTFSATATEGNNNGWWLAICQTDAITVAAPPLCPGGAYCVSSSFAATGVENNCAWTSSGSGDQIWYGFACNEAGTRCSVNSNANSPITVNEAPTDNFPTSTLNSPVDYYNTSSSSITFECSAYDDINLIDVSLYTNTTGSWALNETNSSGINNTNYLFSKTISDGSYLWNCETCDNSSQCSFATSNRTLTIDSTPPAITLPEYTNATPKKSSDSLTLNISVSDLGIGVDTCIVNIATATASNQTIAYSNGWCNGTYSLTGTSEGNQTINVYANDTLSNWGLNDSYVVWIDNTGPTLNTEGANETSITENSYFCLNITVTDAISDVDTVYAEVWDTSSWSNYTMSEDGTSCDGTASDGIYGVEIQGTSQGIWNYSKAHANDSLGNQNTYDFTDLTINVTAPADSEYPQFSNFQEFPTNNSDYSYAQSHQFNTTLTKTNGTIFLEFDGTNYSASNDTPTNFYVDLNPLPAGSYNYFWWGYGNGSNENYNQSSTRNYVIQKTNPTASLTNNDSWTITYPTTLQINYTESNDGDGDVTYKIYRDGADKGSGETILLGYGTYDYVLNTTGGTNYTANSSIEAQTLTVDQNAGLCNVSFNETSPITYPATFKVWSNCNSDFTLYRNGTIIANNSEQILAASTYNFTVIRTDNVNYSNAYEEQTFTVNQNAGACGVLFNDSSPITYPTTFRAWSNCNSDFTLYRNGTTITNDSEQALAASTYNFTVIRTDNTNYSDTSDEQTFTIDKATAEIATYINNQRDNQSILINNEKWLNATLITGSGNIELYYNDTLINQGASPLSNLTNFTGEGTFNISGIYPGNENYTADTETWWATVSSDSPPTPSIIYPTNTIYNIDVTQLNYTADDDIALDSCWWSNNSGTWNSSPQTCGTNWTGLTSNEGSNTWTVYANDSIGQEGSDSITFTKDTVYPTFSNYQRNPSTPNEDQNVQLNVTITENNKDTIILEWEGTTNYTVTTNNSNEYYFTITTGNYTAHDSVTYYWYANDTAGNLNKSTQQSFTVANQIPSLSTPAINDTTPQTNDILDCTGGTFSDDDAEDSETSREFKWYDDDIEIVGQTSQTLDLSVSDLDKGNVIKCSARVSDSYDWSSWTNSSNTATIQNSPPTITTTQTTVSWDANGSTYNFDYNATDPDEDSLTWYDNTTLFDINSGTGEISDTPIESEAGTYEIKITASDGTTNATDEFTYTINDVTSPTIDFVPTTETNDSQLTRNYIQVNVTATDGIALDTITIYIYNSTSLVQTNTSSSSPFPVNFTNLPDENYYFNATVNDTAGNTNQTETIALSTDTGPPTINYTSPTEDPGAIKSQNYIVVNVTAGDPNLDKITIRLYNSTNDLINSTITSTSPNYINFSGLTDGLYYYNATANDTFGNDNSLTTRNITIDFTSPTLNIAYPQNTIYTVDVTDLNYTFTETNPDKCWYSLNEGATNSSTQTCGTNWTGLTSTEGSNTWTVYANDTAGNENSTSITFNKDTAYPAVTINSPLNQIYDTTTISFNITATDGGAISACWYSLNSGTTNSSLTNSAGDYYTDTNSSMTQGSHTVNYYCNDSSGNLNDTEQVTFSIDSIYPTITSLTESPSDPATYSSGTRYEFNATINDTNIDTVFIEFDGTNYTPSNIAGDIYNFSITDLAAGTYNYSWYVNDSANNINLTNTQTYTINNASGNVSLLINGSTTNQTEVYGVQTNASASTLYGTITLYKNTVNATDENNALVTLAVGYYNYTAISSGDENHSSATITRFVNISRASSEINLSLNNTDGNITITQDSSIYLNATTITGDSGATLRLYNNGTLINQRSSPLNNLTTFNIVGLFNITAIYNQSQNYTESYETWWVNVTEIPDTTNPTVTSPTESPSDPATYSPGATYEFNATITDNRILDTIFIEFDGTNYTPSNIAGDVYNFSITDLAAGTYNYSWYANDTSGNINNTVNGTYTINQETPSLNLTLTPSISETYGTETTASASGCPVGLTCNLYRNDTEVTSPDVATLAAGTYNYTYNTTGNTNYTTASISVILTIDKATAEIATYIDNARDNGSTNLYNEKWLNATLITGSGNIELYYNDTLINQGASPLSNLTNFTSEGTFNISGIYPGNENYTSDVETWWITVALDSPPFISLIYPTNTNYTSVQTTLNYTASDNNLDTCWYSLDKGSTNTTITCGTNITGLNSGQGNLTWTIYANDSIGQENSSSTTFFVDSINPTIQFVSPTTPAATYSQNFIEINATANDDNLDTITIKLYNSTSPIQTNASSTSPFFINYTNLSPGIYYYNATANDTLNNENSTETILINLTLPILTIHSPENATYIANTSLLLNYSASYEDTVWYNLNGTNISITSETYFNTSEGSHTIYLYANNSLGTATKNITFFVNSSKFKIHYNNFKGANKGNSTNFNKHSYSKIQNLSNIILENSEYGKIEFNQAINLTDDINLSDNEINLDSNINISSNKIELNSTALPNFNKEATLYLYGLNFSNPQILKDNVVCSAPDCVQESYSGGTLKFNVTGFTIYEARQTPSITQPPSSSSENRISGGGYILEYECANDAGCKKKDEVCLNNKCVKLFDIKIIDFESPAKLGEFFDFTYFIKGMAEINGDVEVNFWIEGKETVTSGSDVIYIGSFEEKTETTKIFLPNNIESGIYQFFVQINYGNYKVQSHRTIEIELKGGFAKITFLDNPYFYYILGITLIVLIIILLLKITKNNWKERIENWKKNRKLEKEIKSKEITKNNWKERIENWRKNRKLEKEIKSKEIKKAPLKLPEKEESQIKKIKNFLINSTNSLKEFEPKSIYKLKKINILNPSKQEPKVKKLSEAKEIKLPKNKIPEQIIEEIEKETLGFPKKRKVSQTE